VIPSLYYSQAVVVTAGYASAYYGEYLATQATDTAGKQRIDIVRNDAYDGIANPVKTFTVTKDFTGWTGVLTIRHRVTNTVLLSVSVVVASVGSLTATMTSTDTAFTLLTSSEDFGPHPFDIQMINGTSKQTINGIAVIIRDQTLT
jgi:hypothetical protein